MDLWLRGGVVDGGQPKVNWQYIIYIGRHLRHRIAAPGINFGIGHYLRHRAAAPGNLRHRAAAPGAAPGWEMTLSIHFDSHGCQIFIQLLWGHLFINSARSKCVHTLLQHGIISA